MITERTKDVTIGDYQFQVGLLTALEGDRVSRRLGMGYRNITDETWDKIQTIMLSVCRIYEKTPNGDRHVLKLYEDGRWLNPKLGLDCDLETVHNLIEEAIKFNFNDFFLKKIAKDEAELAAAKAAKAAALLSESVMK